MKNFFSHSICLNLCSFCNLKCNWCYKKSDNKGFLTYADFEDFYITLIEQNINKIVLIGGEPTLHPDFISILNILANKQVYLTTNGLMFSNQNFLNDCMKTRRVMNTRLTGLQSISISLKGFDQISFFSTTKVDGFEYLCQAINNLNYYDIPVIYSYTLADNITLNEMEIFLAFLNKYNINSIIINDTRPYIKENSVIYTNIIDNIDELIYYLESHGIIVYFRPNHPLCKYNSELISHMLNNKKIISNCAFKKRNGYFFSSSLELIPCNELYTIILGKYKLDFNNYEELNFLWNSQSTNFFYKKLSGCPQSKCIKCNMWYICGGSCILHWAKEELR